MSTNNTLVHVPLATVIAHRGASGQAPENTISALKLAIQQGASCVEIDASISADGVAYVHHDDTLDRCTDGRGYLCAHRSTELDQLDATVLFPDLAAEPPPRLSAVLELLSEHGIGLNLEIKPTPGLEDPTTDAVCADLDKYWTGNQPLVLSSFSRDAVRRAAERRPDTPRALIVCAVPHNWQQLLPELGSCNLHCDGSLLDASTARQLVDAGYGVYCFTVNDPDLAEALWNSGVHGVFTDHPDRLLASIE